MRLWVRRGSAWLLAGIAIAVPSSVYASFFDDVGTAIGHAAASTGDFFGNLGRGVGGAVGAPIGGLLAAMATPTLETTEATTRKALQDVNGVLANQMDHAQGVGDALLGRTSSELKDRMAQVDTSLAARILQIDTTANGLIDNTLGQIDDISRKRLAQVDKSVTKNIKVASEEAQKRIAQTDQMLTNLQGQFGMIITASITQADDAAAARIEQVDQKVEERMNNADAMVTRQGMNLEAGILRVGTLAALVLFAAFLMWRLLKEVEEAGQQHDRIKDADKGRRTLHQIKVASWHVGLQAVGGAACIAILYFLSNALPSRTEKEAQKAIAEQLEGMDRAMEVLEFRTVKVHAAQLAVLDPGDDSLYLERAKKADLFKAVFQHPGSLFDQGRLRGVLRQVQEVDTALRNGRTGKTPDPDIETIEAFILWQVGGSRTAEYLAANLCADALLQSPEAQHETGPFLLAPLARNYVKVFVDDPYVPDPLPTNTTVRAYSLEEMHKAMATVPADAVFAPLQQAMEYDRLVLALDRDSTREYLAMLESHGQLLVAIKQGAPDAAAKRAERQAHAQKVLEAWQAFDRGLTSNPWISGTRAVLAAFTLNDVILSHALWFIHHPETDQLSPLMQVPAKDDSGLANAVGREGSLAVARATWSQGLTDAAARKEASDRIAIAPIRIAWERRLQIAMGGEDGKDQLLNVVDYQEASRYQAFEVETVGFEQNLISARVGAATGATPKEVLSWTLDAAYQAATLGFKDDSPARRPYSEVLLDGVRAVDAAAADKAKETVDASMTARHVRYL